MTQYRFEYLISLYKTGDLSREEWDELREAIRNGEHDALLEDDIRGVLEEEGVHPSWNRELEASMWASIEQGRTRETVVVEMPKHGRGRVQGLRIAIMGAAAVVVLVCVSIWWWKPLPAAHSAVAPEAAASVHPGTNKAILTLANGQQILLDSSANGQIARQGATTVIKLNGLISYKGGTGDVGNLYNTISTPRGGQYELILPDGSHVWLNSASELRFPIAFGGGRREVSLKGEGYFQIAKDARRPFVVDVNDMKVKVLGTSFNTMAYSEEGTVNTTLVDGSVVVEEGKEQKMLQPGQQACLGREGAAITIRKADVRQVTAWRSGLFEFDNTDLASIMRQLARWYDIDVVYKVTPEKAPLGGSISRNLDLKEVLSLLEANGINHFSIEGKKVIVLP